MFQSVHRSFLSIVVTILIVGQPICTGVTFAQGRPQSGAGTVVVPSSSVENPADVGIRAHTNHLIFMRSNTQVTGVPAGENPGSLGCVYNIVSSLTPGCPIN